MRFLDKSESNQAALKLTGRTKNHNEPEFVLYYNSGRTDYEKASNAIAKSIGNFEVAFLCCIDSIFGDDVRDGVNTEERWQPFYRWRRHLGEPRRLYHTPGHQFDSNEATLLQQTLVWTFELGWDACLFANPGRCHLFFSHNDRVEIFRVREKRKLVRNLEKLEFHQAGGRQ